MKGIILAGGKSLRLYPTKVTSQHLLPVDKEPMIWHTIRQFVASGITELLLITSTEHMGDIVNSIGSGAQFCCQMTYRVQEESKGIAGANTLLFELNNEIYVHTSAVNRFHPVEVIN